MKLRIKGNSIRLRLTKTDVENLIAKGLLEESTSFGESKFVYGLHRSDDVRDLVAEFRANKITVFIPSSFIKDWDVNDKVGFDANMKLNGTDSLYILVEKDFKCLDETVKDQSDNFENPSLKCNE